jgi:hypothetical protein
LTVTAVKEGHRAIIFLGGPSRPKIFTGFQFYH